MREDFCGACVAGITALVGAGTAGGSVKAKDQNTKRIIFWVGMSVSMISIIVIVYILYFQKCEVCSSSSG
jgi:ABC-type proline/glycine betaine transport system permease subunit